MLWSLLKILVFVALVALIAFGAGILIKQIPALSVSGKNINIHLIAMGHP